MRYAETDNYLVSSPCDDKITVTTSSISGVTAYVAQSPTATAVYGTKGSEITLSGGEVKRDGQTVSGTWSWKNTPSDNLNVGNTQSFVAQFTPSDGTRGTLEVPVVPDITPKKLATPSGVVIAAATENSVTLNVVPNEQGIAAQYGIASNAQGTDACWQYGSRFDGLASGTQYWFAIRYVGEGNYASSDVTAWQEALTQGETAPPVANPTVTVTDSEKTIHYGDALAVNVTLDHVSTEGALTLVGAGDTTLATVRVQPNATQATLEYQTAGGVLDASTYTSLRVELAVNGKKVSAAVPSVTVTPRDVTVTGLTAKARAYDGTKRVDIEGTAALSGLVDADSADVSVAGTAQGTLSTADAGTQNVTVSGLTLTGAKASRYTLKMPTLQVDIAKAPATVSAPERVEAVEGDAFSSIANALPTKATGVDGKTIQGSFVWKADGKQLEQDTKLTASMTSLAYTFTPDGSAKNYRSTSGEVSLSVSAFKPTVTISSATTHVTYGDVLTVVARVAGLHGRQGEISLLTQEGSKLVSTSMRNDGEVKLAYDTTKHGLAVGDAAGLRVVLTVADNTATAELPQPVVLEQKTLAVQWTGTDSRVAGDGKKVQASFATQAVSKGDDVSLTLQGVNDDIVGAKTITAKLTGTDSGYYRLDNPTVQFEVKARGAQVAAKNVTVTYGKHADVSVTVSGDAATPTGSVKLYAGDSAKPLATSSLNGHGTATLSYDTVAKQLPVGANTVTVRYDGDTTYASAEHAITITIERVAVTVRGLSAKNRAYDATANVAIEGTPVLEGVIEADRDQIRVESVPQVGTVQTPNAQASAQTVQIADMALTGQGSTYYELTQPQLTVTISPAQYAVSVPSALKVVEGDTFSSVRAQLPTDAAGVGAERVPGTFAWSVDGTELNDDTTMAMSMKQLSYTFTPAPSATNYVADPQSGTVDLTVTPLPDPEVTVAASASQITYGDTLTLISHISGLHGRQGKIELIVDGKPYGDAQMVSKDGDVTFRIDTAAKQLAVGTRTIEAKVSTASVQVQSSAIAVQVTAKPIALVWSNVNDRKVLDGLHVGVALAQDSLVGGDEVSVAITEDTSAVAQDDRTAGDHTVRAQLSGKDTQWYTADNASVTYTIDKRTAGIGHDAAAEDGADANIVEYGKVLSWKVSVQAPGLRRKARSLAETQGTSDSAMPIPSGTVQLMSESKALGEPVALDDQGTAVLSYDTSSRLLDTGMNRVAIRYSGDAMYEGYDQSVEVKLDPIVLSAHGLVAASRAYDGTTRVNVISDEALLDTSAVRQGDIVTPVWPTEGTVVDRNVGTGKQVHISGVSLAGDAATYYTVAYEDPITVDITPATLSASQLPGVCTTVDTVLAQDLPTVLTSQYGDTVKGAFTYMLNGQVIDPNKLRFASPGVYELRYRFQPDESDANYTAQPVEGTVSVTVLARSQQPNNQENSSSSNQLTEGEAQSVPRIADTGAATSFLAWSAGLLALAGAAMSLWRRRVR